MEERDFYTAEEAMNRLKKTKTIFYEMVNNGEIPWQMEPGRKRGKRFPKAAIDVLAQLSKEKPGKSPLFFTPQTVAELWEGLEITNRLYGPEDQVDFKRLMEWKHVNPDIFMSLKEGSKLIGGVTFLPLDEKVAIALVNDEMKEKDISPESVRKWTGRDLSIYIPTIEVLPSGSFRRDRERGVFLLRHTIKWAVMASIQHDVKNWYAVGATEAGRGILETLGFTTIHVVEDGRKGYKLETKKEPVRLIGQYLREIEGEKSA